MTPNLIANIFALCKALAPASVPKPDVTMLNAWTKYLERIPLPESIWEEACYTWAEVYGGQGQINIRDFKTAAYVTRDRWEDDPSKKVLLEQARNSAREERDRLIASGKFGESRGYLPSPEPTAEIESSQPSQDALKQLIQNALKTGPESTQSD